MKTENVKEEINSAKNLNELDSVYRKYLGRKGTLSLALRELGGFAKEERKKRAQELQAVKKEIEAEFARKSEELKGEGGGADFFVEQIDVTAPGRKVSRGSLHPLTQIQNRVNEIFASLGFEIVEGPELETEWYNFDALNIPKDHPARDMWDTFWIASETEKLLLRTHTSPVQIRYMESHQPPFRIIAPGRVFRHEASDASHDMQFYQLEGLMVDKEISVANFKAVIGEFFRALFGNNAKIRLRPSYFPFVEPGFEIDMYSNSGWLEMMGAGMVHPNVFKAAGYNPKDWQGFAFGIGLDRVAMMRYGVDDIRLFYGGDLRFLKQF